MAPAVPRLLVIRGCAILCASSCAVPSPPPAAAIAPASASASLDGANITVSFVDAVVALSHDDGVAWDSAHVVPELTRASLRVARVGRDGYARVSESIASHDAEPWGKPDPVGTVTLMATPSCNRQTLLLPVQRDTYRPSWAPGLTFAHVPFDRATRFRIVLEDDDAPRPNELIGVVDITFAALEEALAKDGAVHRVDVGDQGQPIYFIGIRVTRE